MHKQTIARRSLVGGLLMTLLLAVPAGAALSRFLDVPDGNTFVADIEWLADAGVTNGCEPDRFCPEANVTRQQLAGFLHRLAENEVVKAASAVFAETAMTAGTATSADHATAADDSDLLDGLDSTAFAPGTHNHDTNYLGITDQAADSAALDGRGPGTYDTFVIGDARAAGDLGGYATICTVEQDPFCPITSVSLDGVLVAETGFTTIAANSIAAVTGTTSLSSLETINPFDTYVWLQLDSSTCTDVNNAAATGAYMRQSLSPGQLESISVTIALEIPIAGNHSVALCAQPFAGNAGVLTSTISGVVSASPNNSTSATMYAP